jgi:hypothetical protein
MPRAARAQPSKKSPQTKKTFDLDFRPARYRWPRTSRGAKAAPDAREVVLARIRVASTHGDVIALRAKRTDDGRIRYRMVHEDAHGHSNRPIRIRPASSERPITFGELVDMLDRAYYHGAIGEPEDQERFGGVIWGTLQLHFDHGVDHADGYLFFTSVESEHYPQLEAYYMNRMSEWCLANCIEEDDCKKIVRMRLKRG